MLGLFLQGVLDIGGQVMLTEIDPACHICSPESENEAQLHFMFRFNAPKHKQERVGEVDLFEVLEK
jgi:hypothetical protein